VSRYHSYLNTAKTILHQYKGDEPFASFLKKIFSLQKKYGSKDRKTISHLCYCFFRLGKTENTMQVEEKILLSLFFCSLEVNEVLQELKPEWNDLVDLSLSEKYSIFNNQHSRPDRISRAGILNVFPWKDELSDEIDHEKFCASFFIQPDVFLRLRPDHETWVKEKLLKANMTFHEISENCPALPSSSKIDQVLALDYEAVIQDLSSQQTAEFFKLAISGSQLPFISAWDCCAGSGGKSIMLFDLYNQLDLTVSDIRESIITNLEKRFKEAEIKNYDALVSDIVKSSPRRLANSKFDIIICDAPCTGSGTWGRTPEQLHFFDEKKIDEYAARQKKIVANVIPHLGKQSFFIYITCSVFKKENEDVVEFIKQESHLQLIKMEVLKGYDKNADTMFVALFRKPL
jgi:16S rRNA (cytosine967-C5)-methyltransferase